MSRPADGEGLRVLLVDHSRGRLALLERALSDAGYQVVAKVDQNDNLLRQVERHTPDIIIIDLDSPDRDTLEQMHTIHSHQPRPVVMFAEDDGSETIRQAVRAGVSAYIVDGLQQNRVRPVMEVAIARFREYQALRDELTQTRESLEERKVIERAKGLLMVQRDLDEEGAYQLLRKLAMDQGQRLVEVARTVVSLMDLDG